MLQCENLNDLETNGERQAHKTNMMPEISLCASRTQSNTDSHEIKQGFKQISQTASDSSLQREMRTEASPQVLFKTPPPKKISEASCFQKNTEDIQMPGKLCKSGQSEDSKPDTFSKIRYTGTKKLH